jgi:hypothetical protein
MPPPTVTMFLPFHSSRGKLLPRGPRMKKESPASSSCRAAVFLPAFMMLKRR